MNLHKKSELNLSESKNHRYYLTTGGYFEGSTGAHKLIGVLTDSWAKKQLLATGRPPDKGEINLTTGLMRRRLSTAIVKANMSVLLGRRDDR